MRGSCRPGLARLGMAARSPPVPRERMGLASIATARDRGGGSGPHVLASMATHPPIKPGRGRGLPRWSLPEPRERMGLEGGSLVACPRELGEKTGYASMAVTRVVSYHQGGGAPAKRRRQSKLTGQGRWTQKLWTGCGGRGCCGLGVADGGTTVGSRQPDNSR